MPKAESTPVVRHCICGDAAVGVISPPEALARFDEAWGRMHAGPGHAPCTADEARFARRRREAERARAA